MGKALQQAFDLLFSGDVELWNIVSVTMRMTLTSSLAALLLGAPLGVLYAGARFPGRKALIVLNRTLMGVPPVVCGLLCYLLFSGVGPLRHLQLLFTVNGMIVSQVLLITPIVAGNPPADWRTETFLPVVGKTASGADDSIFQLIVRDQVNALDAGKAQQRVARD